MKAQLNELLTKEMTRKEFMTALGMGMLSMLGFSTVLKFMLDTPTNSNSKSARNSNGYGSSPYGV